VLTHDDFVLSALIEEKVITRAQADAAVKHAAEKGIAASEAVAELEYASSRVIALVRAQTTEYPLVDPAWFDINLANTGYMPKATAESLRAFPLFVTPEVATVAMVDPLDLKAVDQLRSLLKVEVDAVLCETQALLGLIERAYALTGGVQRPGAGTIKAAEAEAAALTTGKEPVVAAVNQIIAQGIELGASDIHIGPDDYELHLRYRVDGVLVPNRGPSLDMHQSLVQRLKVMAMLDLTQTRRPQDGKFRFTHNARTVDIRLSLIPTVAGENVVMRVLSTAASIRGFTDLGFPTQELSQLEEALDSPYGMVLVTGPTGSGKTTTLYTALKRMNTADLNIMTIEDPVEIRMPLIRQVQTNAEIGMTFAGALRSILRQDPDVVFVGEIRDEETARISVQAALTGHLVLSSLHTNDAAGAIPRLRDLGCPNFAINAALVAVVAQRLVRRVCPDCALPDVPDPVLLKRFGLSPDDATFVRGKGCARCGNIGARGRVGVYELLQMTPNLRRVVDAGSPAVLVRQTAESDGMRPMWVDGLNKARYGLTTLDEVARVVAVQATEPEQTAPTNPAPHSPNTTDAARRAA
jgi:type II secretory ATPase GspE/PulE/Tfp pilus assembly ATPase PilB-like protein